MHVLVCLCVCVFHKDTVKIPNFHLMMFTRSLVGIPKGFRFQSNVTYPTDRLLKFIVPVYIKQNVKQYPRKKMSNNIYSETSL